MEKKLLSIENLILLGVFLSPCSDLFVFKTVIFDVKILQFLWSIVFISILICKASFKDFKIGESLLSKKDHIIFVLYITSLVLSCLFSFNFGLSFKELLQYIYLFLIMLVIYKYSNNEDMFNKIIHSIILCNILLVTVSIISYLNGRLLIPSFIMYPDGSLLVIDSVYKTQALVESNSIINRLEGVMGLGTVGIANCILIQSLFINYMVRKSSGRMKTFYLVVFAANVVAMGLTYSRAALITFIIIHFISLLGSNRKTNFALAIIGVCSIPIVLSFFPSLYERLLEAFNTQEGSTKYHLVQWMVSLKEGYDHMATGIGIGNAAFQQDMYKDMFSYLFRKFNLYNVNGSNVHNFILQIWAEQGLTGLVTNMALIFYPIVNNLKFKYISRAKGEKTISDYILLAYVATLFNNLTNNNFYIETFWILAGLAYASLKFQPADFKEAKLISGRDYFEETYFKTDIKIEK